MFFSISRTPFLLFSILITMNDAQSQEPSSTTAPTAPPANPEENQVPIGGGAGGSEQEFVTPKPNNIPTGVMTGEWPLVMGGENMDPEGWNAKQPGAKGPKDPKDASKDDQDNAASKYVVVYPGYYPFYGYPYGYPHYPYPYFW